MKSCTQKGVILFLFCILSTPQLSKAADPWVAYNDLLEDLRNHDNGTDLSSHFSERMMSIIHDRRQGDHSGQVGVARHPLWFEEIHSKYYSSPKEEKSCLTVNGFRTDGRPGTITVRFVEERGSLKSDYVGYIAQESDRFFIEGVCCPEDTDPAREGDSDRPWCIPQFDE